MTNHIIGGPSAAVASESLANATSTTELATDENPAAPAATLALHKLAHPAQQIVEQPNYMFVDLRTSMGGRFLLRVRDTDTIERIKVKIASRLNIAVRQQCLLLNGIELQDKKLVPECGITEASSLMLIVRLNSGPIRQLSYTECHRDDNGTVVVDSVAAHLTDPSIQQAIARGEEVSFVTRISGRYMMVRLNHNGQTSGACTCGEHHEDDNRSSSPSPSDSDQVTASFTRLKLRHENFRMRDRIADIRARLHQRTIGRASRREVIDTPVDPESTAMSTVSPGAVCDDAIKSNENVPGSPGKARSHKRTRRCHACPVKLGLVHFPCKCGHTFCNSHREATAHSCAFNYHVDGPTRR